MWPFNGKKVLKPENLPLGEDWRVAEGNHDGNPMFVRTNAAYRGFKGVEGYRTRLGSPCPCLTRNRRGFLPPLKMLS
jgi:hypothetical protein